MTELTRYQGQTPAPFAVYRSPIVGMAGVLPADLGIAGYSGLVDLDTLRGVDALETYDGELRARAVELDKEFVGLPMSDEAKAEFDAIADALVNIEGRRTELKARDAFIREISDKPANTVAGAYEVPNVAKGGVDNVFDLTAYRRRVSSVDELPQAYRDGAMKVIETAVFPTLRDKAASQAHIEGLLAKDKTGALAHRIIGTGSPTYMRAFEQYVTRGLPGMTPQFQAAMQTYSDTDGGYAIPFTIDPTLVLTSDGAVNPLRQISKIKTITTKAWQGVTTEGVVAAYKATETTAASDNAPTDLDDPTATPVGAHVWIPFTAEFAEDYGSELQAELGGLVQDAKDVLEADKFVMGDGSGEPEGIVAAIITDTTSLVTTITNDVFARADLNKLEGAVPPRFRTKATILANKAIMQTIRGFGTAGEPTNALYDATAGTLLGYPFKELSAMDDVATDAKEIVLMGDFRYFVIVDRVGLAIEYIPQVFDGSGMPLGQRGIYARWRNTSKVLSFNAFRLLKVQ
jgi:HK97 family phage major capsid protein